MQEIAWCCIYSFHDTEVVSRMVSLVQLLLNSLSDEYQWLPVPSYSPILSLYTIFVFWYLGKSIDATHLHQTIQFLWWHRFLFFKYLSRCSWHEKTTGRLSIWHEPFSFDIIWTIRNLGLAAGHVGITKYSPSSQEVHHFGPTQKSPETYKNQHCWPESQVKRQGIVYLIVLCECCPNCGPLWTIRWVGSFLFHS